MPHQVVNPNAKPLALRTPAMPSMDFVRRNLLVVRESDVAAEVDDRDDNLIDLALVFLGLIFLGLIVASGLFLVRRQRLQRQMQQDTLPTYNDGKRMANHRGLTIETTHNGRSSVFFIGRDGQPMLQNPRSPPHSPDNVPQIHITFPDEHDDKGHLKSGRVLVVRVGDNATVGLEPIQDEPLPAYEKESKGEFYSIDMNQIGGLKEKNSHSYQ
ncbi:hypothetical protein S7711_04385 [Stachybotrys chartarum IBT 7711]|uniref:Uncharacterized protein n=1 Tax=Stachybotrys chartarum (strain CBS 109288 / IBT 7711) TaxID=1280523 RepID=A0A084AY98_STACB|nr:hypothetical protein S7711_04385 [Stachybotrys chartarum IBT 7711]KFA55768.1 hypothetical protein S40293_01953 [Stachybotrys chartarum IBT 40293]KFA79539.1 hypothetical protein S40288_01112 [Stachybotrys chartarum IBT 40288]